MTHKSSIKLLFSFLSLLFIFIAAGCGNETQNEQAEEQQTEETAEQTEEAGQPADYPDVEENPEVTITMENDEEIKLELLPEHAPNTVANFISLTEEGFYDGLIFHRVIPEFMIQGGDPQGTGMGGPDYTIPGEFAANGFENELKHERGVVSMARSQEPDSAGSQFFIMVAASSQLDGQYAAFGRVTEGMEVVDAIVEAETDGQDKPLEDQHMKTVEVDTKGHDYPEPVKAE